MKKILMVVAVAALMVGCQTTKSTSLTVAELYGKYNLVNFDSEVVQASERPMTIGFEPGVEGKVKVHGVLCNTFIGQAVLNQGKLTSDGLASTRMACFREKEAAMETALGDMFKTGATVKLKGPQLILEGSGHTFTYQKQ
ncbi:META domain-containing protein [Entomomonas sp. E2T0]|uniref:META domain-containing protein n=1 Tax=Entomomonas sp. E2T0 TaxID=2930213 RepID=UPI002228249B|nr:META domain-containing protein [Entomomonas sp. E2T0]UYZ84793.1 META domain-containing protein [Entomomonas sp. E2T0]